MRTKIQLHEHRDRSPRARWLLWLAPLCLLGCRTDRDRALAAERTDVPVVAPEEAVPVEPAADPAVTEEESVPEERSDVDYDPLEFYRNDDAAQRAEPSQAVDPNAAPLPAQTESLPPAVETAAPAETAQQTDATVIEQGAAAIDASQGAPAPATDGQQDGNAPPRQVIVVVPTPVPVPVPTATGPASPQTPAGPPRTAQPRAPATGAAPVPPRAPVR
jgi:hypothetical protein